MKQVLAQLEADKANGLRSIALLVDPDKAEEEHLEALFSIANRYPKLYRYLLVGGSLVGYVDVGEVVRRCRSYTDLPILLFPGSPTQLSKDADGVLLLSLVSGRNAELLIGKQVEAAPSLKRIGIQVLPTAYMLVDGGAPTTASYISGTQPLPANKPEIAAATALAATQLGMRVVYLDSGSGAKQAVPPLLITKVAAEVDAPVVVGGGMRSAADVKACWNAGATVAVIGSIAEDDPKNLSGLAEDLLR